VARRRDPSESVRFDLEPHDEDALGDEHLSAPAEDAPRYRPPRAADPAAARRRRWTVVVSAVCAVLVAAAAAAAASYRSAADHYLLERLASAPGGVVGLDRPPTERWSTSLAAPTPVAVLGGLLVVASQGDPSDGATLHGIDPRTGHVRWHVRLPGVVDCGAGPRALAFRGPMVMASRTDVETVGTLACLTGEQRDGVVVVAPGGRILAKRPIADREDGELIGLGPNGTLLRVDVVGGPDAAVTYRDGAPSPSPDGAITPVLDVPLVVHDRRIRLENAVTGAALWTTTVTGSTVPEGTALGSRCILPLNVDLPASLAAGLASTYARTGSTAWYSTCGIDVTLDLATGAVLTSHAGVNATYQVFGSPIRPLGSGASAVQAQADSTESVTIGPDGGVSTTAEAPDGADPEVELFGPGGRGVGEVTGNVLTPWATDGSGAAVLVTAGAAGTSVYDAVDASRRWTNPGSAAELLVRSADALVLSSGVDITARDARTGARLWRSVPGDPGHGWSGGPFGPDGIVAVYTDRRQAVMVEALDDDGRTPQSDTDRLWTAVDLTTGARKWRATAGGPVPTAIAGHLYRFDVDAVVQLG
jgi:hypothetical protein